MRNMTPQKHSAKTRRTPSPSQIPNGSRGAAGAPGYRHMSGLCTGRKEMPRGDDSLTIAFPVAARRLCATGAPKLQRGQGFDDLGMHVMVGLPAGHVRRFSRAFAAKVHYFTANSWNCAAAQHHGQDHAFDNLCAQLLDMHLAHCSTASVICTVLTLCRSVTTRRMKRSKQLFRSRR